MYHEMPLRIYFQDTDAGGIVYHSNYLNYAERARCEFMHAMDCGNVKLMERGIAFVIRHAELDYFAPARLDDLLTIRTCVREIKNASLRTEQIFLRGAEELVRVKLRIAFIDPKTLAPIRMPAFLKDVFATYLEQGDT